MSSSLPVRHSGRSSSAAAPPCSWLVIDPSTGVPHHVTREFLFSLFFVPYFFFFFLSSFALTNTGAKNKKLKSRVKLETEEFFSEIRNQSAMERTCALRSVGVCFWHAPTLNDLKKICACYYFIFFLFLPAARFFIF